MEETGTMMLQDIWPHRLRNQFTDKTDPTPDSPVFCFRKADLLTASSRDDAMEEEIDQSGEHGKIGCTCLRADGGKHGQWFIKQLLR